MFDLIIQNLLYLMVAIGLLALGWVANFVIALVIMKISTETFDKVRFRNGLLRVFGVIVSAGLLAILITLMPIAMVYFGIPIPEEYVTLFSVLTIIAIFMKSIIFYINQTYEKLNKVLGDNGIVLQDVATGIIEDTDIITKTVEVVKGPGITLK